MDLDCPYELFKPVHVWFPPFRHYPRQVKTSATLTFPIQTADGDTRARERISSSHSTRALGQD